MQKTKKSIFKKYGTLKNILSTGFFLVFFTACIEDPTSDGENKHASKTPPEENSPAPVEANQNSSEDLNAKLQKKEPDKEEKRDKTSFLRPLRLKTSLLSPSQKEKHQRLAQNPQPVKEGVTYTCTLNQKTVILRANQYQHFSDEERLQQQGSQATGAPPTPSLVVHRDFPQNNEILLCDLFIGSVLFSFANHEAEHCFYRLGIYIASLSQRGYECHPSDVVLDKASSQQAGLNP